MLGFAQDHGAELFSSFAEATGGVADEQYVRNVVDILYRARSTDREKSSASG